MNVLVACEFSGVVRDAFIARGHKAISCDLLPSERTGPHDQRDVLKVLKEFETQIDLMIAHPPCTYLCLAGMRWNNSVPGRQVKTHDAVHFVRELLNSRVRRICLENPVGVISKYTGIKWDQMIHPWQFGHPEEKKTCLWLKNLPPLKPTKICEVRESKMFWLSPSKDRWKIRSRTYQGIADAMAIQWGNL